ncbi:MAG: ATP-dependent zinc metalloprotease FtsH [Proteobacteria bacterium]|nr:ATP-dependent zinc metalloprotease FtsH [Pseudomonadota bacterium]
MQNNFKNFGLFAVIFVGVFILAQMFSGSQSHNLTQMPFSDFLNAVKAEKISEVTINGNNILIRAKDGTLAATYAPDQTSLVPILADRNVTFRAIPPEEPHWIMQALFSWFPFLLFIIYMLYAVRNMQGGGKAMGFGKSKAKLMSEQQSKLTFADVAGIDEAKAELEEIVDFLKSPQKFQKLGGKIPKGVLLVGPPGTGKTLLAKAIAGEAKVPFFSISGSDFVEMFVGVGASRVRDMFEQAKKNAPCILFIDEIDAVGRHRGMSAGGGNDEREQTLNQLLVEMDGFEENQGIIIVAATNRPDILDPALLRPGRFDRRVDISNPDLKGREKILLVHIKKVPLASDVDLKVIARGTPGFSGADLANLVNEAALMAASNNKLAVGMHEFDQAKDKILMGSERRSLTMTEQERKKTAYHEAGHAIIAHFTPGSDPIHKATIIPRGRALGEVRLLPEGDSISESRKELMAFLKVFMGGRLAEEIIFGYENVTSGASNDIKNATSIARYMIMKCGFSDKLGFQNFSSDEKSYSSKTAELIDSEVKVLLDTCYKESEDMLKEHLDNLHLLAKSLLEHETLSGSEITSLLEKGKVDLTTRGKKTKNRSTVPSVDG